MESNLGSGKNQELPVEEIVVDEMTVKELPRNASEVTQDLQEMKRRFTNVKGSLSPEVFMEEYDTFRHKAGDRVMSLLAKKEVLENFKEVFPNKPEVRTHEREFQLTLEGGEKLTLKISLFSYVGAYHIIHDGSLEYVPKYECTISYVYPIKKTSLPTDPQQKALSNPSLEFYSYTLFTDSLDKVVLPEGQIANTRREHNGELLLNKEQEEQVLNFLRTKYLEGEAFQKEDLLVSENIKSFMGGRYAAAAEEYRAQFEDKS